MGWSKGVLGAAMALAPLPASAQGESGLARRTGPELAVGVLDHGVRLFRESPPPGFGVYEGEEERGTADVQLVYRGARLPFALGPRLNARLQINTGGRTNFASVGAEWRQHVLGGRVYGQTGIGLTIHDGYRFLPDPFAPGLSLEEVRRRAAIYSRNTGFGSRVLFNPNLSIGVRVNERWAVEAAWEHFSHKEVFSNQNPGIDMIGIRLVRGLGR